jgi:hypothetical protein
MKLGMTLQQIQGYGGSAASGATDKYWRKFVCHE